MCLRKWSRPLLHFLMHATLLAVPISTKHRSNHLKMQSNAFISSGRSFKPLACGRRASRCRASTHSYTIHTWPGSLAHQGVYAPLSLNRVTSLLSSAHGGDPIAMRHWGKCCSQTSGWTSLPQHVLISCVAGCLLHHTMLRWPQFYCLTQRMMMKVLLMR